MTYKITALQDWGGSSKGSLSENIYYVDSVDIEEAIEMFNREVKNNQDRRPQIIEYITKIERLDHVKLLS